MSPLSLLPSRLYHVGIRSIASAARTTLLRRIATSSGESTSGFVQDADAIPSYARREHPSASPLVVDGFFKAGITYDRSGEPYYDLAERLFVSNLVEEIANDELRESLGRFGQIIKCIRHHPNEATVYFKIPPNGITAALVHQSLKQPFKLKGRILYLRVHTRAASKPLRDDVVVAYNIPPDVTPADIEQLFALYNVRTVTIHRAKFYTDRARAFVRLGSKELVDRLMKDLSEKRMELFDRPLRILRKTNWGDWRHTTSSATLGVKYPPDKVPTAQDEFIAAVKPYGAVKAVRFLRTVPGRPKGLAYLDFDSEDAANGVLEAHKRSPIKIRDIELGTMFPATPLIPSLFKRNEEYRKVVKAIYHQDVRSRRLPSPTQSP